MNKCLSAAVAATLALATGACQQPTAQQINQQNTGSRIYIGALTCNVSGSTGYVLGSTKKLDCVFLNRNGTTALYDGEIRKVGIDIGYTRAVHSIWRVYSLGSDKGADALGGNYIGEQSTVAMSSQAGGNWLYGGSNNQVVLQATQLQDSTNAGYNLAYGIAEISLTPRN